MVCVDPAAVLLPRLDALTQLFSQLPPGGIVDGLLGRDRTRLGKEGVDGGVWVARRCHRETSARPEVCGHPPAEQDLWGVVGLVQRRAPQQLANVGAGRPRQTRHVAGKQLRHRDHRRGDVAGIACEGEGVAIGGVAARPRLSGRPQQRAADRAVSWARSAAPGMKPHGWAFLAGQLRELGGDVDRSRRRQHHVVLVAVVRVNSRWGAGGCRSAFSTMPPTPHATQVGDDGCPTCLQAGIRWQPERSDARSPQAGSQA